MRVLPTRLALAAALLSCAGGGAIATAPDAAACGSAVVWGNGGGQCDGPVRPDGSFQRCTTVYVLGIGGTNCYDVPPPPPPPPR